MAYYKDLSDMFQKRAEQVENKAKQFWAKAKNGEGGENYGKARINYKEADRLKEDAKNHKGKSW